MADDIGFNVVANVDGVKSSMNQAGESVKKFADTSKHESEGIGEIFEGAKTAVEALIAAFAIEKLLEFGNEVAEIGEQLDRMSKMTGLSTDAIQDFQFAVEMTGGNAESAASSLLRFGSNLGKAQEGAGPAAAAYKAMGINLFDLNGHAKSSAEILSEVAEVFSQTDDGARKLEYATALGSRGFAQLISVLDEGPEGLKKFHDILEKTNSKLSPEAVEAADATAKKFTELKASWMGLKESVNSEDTLGALYEGLNKITQALTDGVKEIKSWDDAWKDWTQNGMLARNLGEGNYGGQSKTPGGGMVSNQRPGTIVTDSSDPFGPNQQKKKQLPALGDGGVADAAAEKEQEQIENMELAHKLEMAKLGFQGQKEALDQELAAGKITAAEKFQTLETYAQLEFQVADDALAKQQGLYDEGTAEYQKALYQRQVLTQQYQNQLSKINAEAGKAQTQQYKGITDTITHATDSMLQGVLQGTQTWHQAISHMFANLAIAVAQHFANMAIQSAIGLATEKTTAQKSVGVSAGKAAAAVYADVAAIPYVGWLLAPPAAAAAFVAVEAFGAGFSAEGGFDVPAGVNPVTQLHEREMVLPADLADNVRNATGGDGGTHLHFHGTVIGTKQWFMENGPHLAASLKTQMRNANPNMQNLRV